MKHKFLMLVNRLLFGRRGARLRFEFVGIDGGAFDELGMRIKAMETGASAYAGFKYDIVQSMKYFAPLLNDDVFTIVETGTGNPLPYQTGANSIGYTDLVRLEHSVDPSYRRNGKYMFHDTTLSALKQILDKYGRPLWVPGMKDDAPDTIMGYPYVINQSMPTISSAANTVAFGDMSQFVVRKVSDMTVQRLNELYATTGQVGFVSTMRFDAKLVETSGRALNCLQQHS